MIIVIIIGVVAILFVNGIVASEMSDSAETKGHDKRRYFHFCFWLGIVGYLIVIALPDLEAREQGNQILLALQSNNDYVPANASKAQLSQNVELPPL